MVAIHRPAVKLAAVLAILGCQSKGEPPNASHLPLQAQHSRWAARLTPEQRLELSQRYQSLTPRERQELGQQAERARASLTLEERKDLERYLRTAYEKLPIAERTHLELELRAAHRNLPPPGQRALEEAAPFLRDTPRQPSPAPALEPAVDQLERNLGITPGLQGPGTVRLEVPRLLAQIPVLDAPQGSLAASTDLDGDGLPDDFESQVADAFTPNYFVSAGENDVFVTFQDRVPETIDQRFGSVPPISYFRVQPLGFVTAGVEYGLLRIDYLTLWDKDDGLAVTGTCLARAGVAMGLIGLSAFLLFDALEISGHEMDNERSAALVAAPTPSPGVFNFNASAYKAYNYYTAAHEGTFTDHSFYVFPSQPVDPGVHIPLALSRQKHSTYPIFNPNGFRLIPGWLIDAGHLTVDFLYFSGRIDFLRAGILHFIIDSADSCIAESFTDRGGTLAGLRINVGEPNQPMPGQRFIGDSRLDPKLRAPLWIIVGGSCRPGSCVGVGCGLSDGCGGTCCAGSGCTVTSCGSCRTPNACGSGCVPAFDGAACTTSTGDAGVCQNGACLCGCGGRSCGQPDSCGTGEICCAGSGCSSVGCPVCQSPNSCGSACAPSPDGTACPGGSCQGGTCQPVSCGSPGAFCRDDSECCSGTCDLTHGGPCGFHACC